MRAAVYLRVSTEEQRERQSIQNQRDFAENFCATNRIQIVDWYADDGVSGTIPLHQREQGTRLLDDARQGRFDTVLVYKLDRLGRDPRMILNAVSELETAGARLRSMTEPFDTKDPSGRFMLSVLAGVAGFERDNILQRSLEGTNRLARDGAWLGGIVPYGYSVEGKKRDARLVVSEAPIGGSALSEAGVVRRMYELAGQEGKSCIFIAEHLNQLGIPPAYVRDGRELRVGKRKQATSGIWRPARVRNLLINTTYRGIHQYGKRSKTRKSVIERPVPAIVDESLWREAQETLRRNFFFSRRNSRRLYLLRGLAKCGLCGLTYTGAAYSVVGGGEKLYYGCNGKMNGRGIYGARGKTCPSKSISGSIEQIVWRDIEGFLRNPGPVLQQLQEQMKQSSGKTTNRKQEVNDLTKHLRSKAAEKDRILSLYRRGRIDDRTLDRQMDEIGVEEEAFRERIQQLEIDVESARMAETKLESTAELLRELNRRLDEPLTWELQRQLVELLVEGIRVDTIGPNSKRDSKVTVTYRFSASPTPIETRTGARAATSATAVARAGARPPVCATIARA